MIMALYLGAGGQTYSSWSEAAQSVVAAGGQSYGGVSAAALTASAPSAQASIGSPSGSSGGGGSGTVAPAAGAIPGSSGTNVATVRAAPAPVAAPLSAGSTEGPASARGFGIIGRSTPAQAVTPQGLPVTGPVSAGAGQDDPFAAFKTAYRAALGRDATQADLMPLALEQLSNQLLLTLPDSALAFLSPKRLLELPNEGLIRAARRNPNILGSVPVERFAGMPRGYVDQEVLPFLDQQDKTAADKVRAAIGAAPGSASATGTPPAAGAPAPGAAQPPTANAPAVKATPGQFAARPIEDLLGLAGAIGQTPNFGGLTDVDVAYNFPFDPEHARDLGLSPQAGERLGAENMVRAFGLNPRTGNPMANFLAGQVPRMGRLATDFLTGQGASATGPRDIMQSVANNLGTGALYFSPAIGDQTLNNAYDVMTKYLAAPASLSPAQQGLAKQVLDPGAAFGTYTRATEGGLSPFLRRYIPDTYEDLYADFLRRLPSQPNQTFFGSLLRR